MLMTFRLMLPFTLFDPMKKSMANLFIAVGKPEITVRIRIIQLTVMIAGLFTLGRFIEIEGVALAVDLMMLVGIVLILLGARAFVDFSVKKLFLFPMLGLALGLIVVFYFEFTFSQIHSDVVTGLIKTILFSLAYFGILLIFDLKEIKSVLYLANKYLLKKSIV
jgi:O-antigen/teichoic acid export membrane protein